MKNKIRNKKRYQRTNQEDKMKTLTREEWEELESKELEREERIERGCEKLSKTKPMENRLKLSKKIFKKMRKVSKKEI